MGIIFFLLTVAIFFRWISHGWEHIVDSDGRGYYAYLPAIFTYHDLDFRYFFSGKLLGRDLIKRSLCIIVMKDMRGQQDIRIRR